ncbi:MFS transporter [Curtobacterium sp. ISL-83]|uniref:MFS transporter n=1 Tax=Curtobacterium sp. ISL-83 TaxID=2819145 RepID=UPI001BE7E4DC|nr:MFS transporter [Curtobacterium sp. ISL-83]MBT2502330.1 MFS transporter [Curtobacterium sp. ISL-83]
MPAPDEHARNAPPALTDIPLGPGSALETGAELIGAAVAPGTEDRPRVGRGYITALIVAFMGLYVAFITPIGYSLAIRVAQIDPAGKNAAIALAIAIPGIIVIFTSPIAGVLSDRTMSKFGRRRPWFLAGLLLGLAGSLVVGLAPSVAVLIAGWSLAYIGYSIAAAMILTHLSDLLPEGQRGKVAGLSGAVTQIGPIIGIVFAGAFVKVPVAMFGGPAVLALILGAVFVAIMRDEPITVRPGKVDVRSLANGFYFNPRKFPNLGWVWISRALIFLALSFSTTYGIYLVSQRLTSDPTKVAAIVATAGFIGLVTAILGAVLSGFLSDRLHSRKPFLIGSAVVLAGGLLLIAFMDSQLQYIIGSAVLTFAVGVYGAVDQAIQLDVLPQEENQNGRFITIIGLASQIPQAAGPLVAGGIIALASGEYTVVYIIGAIVAVLGAGAIVPISIGRRRAESTTSIRVAN